MSRKMTILVVSLFALSCLAIGVLWTLRTQPPSLNPWWAGKDAKVRMEVWEPGKDMATVAMTLPKRTVDMMVALGFGVTIGGGGASINVGSGGTAHRIKFKDFWRDLQRLPPGEKLRYRDDDATVVVWIEAKGVSPREEAPRDTADTGS